MDVTFVPSLEHSTILDCALSIVKSRPIKKLIATFKVYDRNNFGWTDAICQEQWALFNDVATIVFLKIVHPMHKGLQDRVVGVVRSICIEIQKWTDDHRHIEIIDNIEDSLYWSHEGLIDRKKTAKELVRNENLYIQSRFELACNYCFMNYVKSLWNLMSKSEKRRYSGEHIQNSRILDFWTKWLTTGARKGLLLSPDRDFDELCFNAYYSNSIALRYFLQLLTTKDKKEYLTKIAKERYLIPKILSFCLLEMDCDQKAEMFKKTPFKTLKCFLNFPWQNSFLLVTLYMQPYLRETDFVYLIYFIIYEKIIPQWKDYNYMELLTEFWIQSPYRFKEYVSSQEIFKIVNFIIGQMIYQGSVSTPDLHNFLKDFPLQKETEKMYQKACRSF
ncbi:unnamed protein product [Larinioides sclopetarius]|uniref:Uncharacterized protein n=1 Tax=Larinioides sclopetarius TaxID=280406 RepID=A0AAV2AV80_9ARAC